MIFWWFISVLMVSFEEINVLTALVWQTALCAHVHVLIHSIAPCRVPALLGNLSASLWTWVCSVSFPLRFEADERSVEEVVWGAVWLAHKLGPRLKTRAASLYQRPACQAHIISLSAEPKVARHAGRLRWILSSDKADNYTNRAREKKNSRVEKCRTKEGWELWRDPVSCKQKAVNKVK